MKKKLTEGKFYKLMEVLASDSVRCTLFEKTAIIRAVQRMNVIVFMVNV